MAAPHDASHDPDYQRGSQEIREQVSTYALFLGMTKWGTLGTSVLILFLTLWFMPHGGFMLAAIASAVTLVIGWFALKSKPAAH